MDTDRLLDFDHHRRAYYQCRRLLRLISADSKPNVLRDSLGRRGAGLVVGLAERGERDE
jgi:hypothetical protein